MQNVSHQLNEKTGILTITIDTKKEFGLSASGKTISIASTKGNKDVGGGIILGLNLYKYPSK